MLLFAYHSYLRWHQRQIPLQALRMVSIQALILVSNNVENPSQNGQSGILKPLKSLLLSTQLGRGGGVGGTTVASEFSDEASIHKVQFFKGLVHFQL